MRGRKPSPKEGSVRPLKSGFPTPPKDLSAGAKSEWTRVRKVMGGQLIGQFDLAVFRVYCEAVSAFVEAAEQIQSEGRIIMSPKGHPLENPWLWIQERAARGILKTAGELGLTPIARTRLAAEYEDEAEKRDEQVEPQRTLKIAGI